ncbi:DNA cytosine methyltransferase [Bradyrhizobium yuanmingense]|uniref:DNA cytosine methyltransferase n=1 Tax=Bradyrhizobium yuanmingense TaxID=108015 RepID=UPI0021A5971C|nr:DNA cytosine methyltransferase [Bradyrhizobium sp. CB1024]UWU84926.1 DNA cytosine methyltransferase [Bradyrhizobium sp. CB1024]
MSDDLRTILRQQVLARSSCSRVALLLSGGADSVVVGYVCQEVGKEVVAYTYELDGIPSVERPAAEAIARHMGWPLRVVRVPTAGLRAAFLRLAIQHGCSKKTQFEVTYPIAHVIPEVAECDIFTGWNFDDHLGNTREDNMEMARLKRVGLSRAELQVHFDALREAKYAKSDALHSPDTFWFATRIASALGKRLIDPSIAEPVRRFFRQFSHGELSPLDKPVIRKIFADAFRRLPQGLVAKGVKLQKGGGVHELFETLVDDPIINRFETKYATVSALCKRWASEVRANPDQYLNELATAPPLRKATVIRARGANVRRPTMAEVHAASLRKRFTVVSLFAGGGGSSMGYRLAGGDVRAINEFVAEAARTYSRNFPGTLIDTREIRDLLRDPADIIAFLMTVGLMVGELDLLDGSPPCSEFSTAGNGPTEPGVLKAYSDRTQKDISMLPFEFARFALIARPKVVVMENVPALASRGEAIFNALLKMLSAEFVVTWRVLSANDFGVPQTRRRLFVLAVRKDVAEAVGITSEFATSLLFPNPTHTGTTIRDAFAGLNQSHDDVRPWIASARTTTIATAASRLPKNPPRLLRPNHVGLQVTGNYTLTRCSYDLPAPTLTVTGQQPSGLAGAIHPEHDRKFTIPELKRLTGLPDDYALTGTLGQAAERICRMVTPFVTEAIAESIYRKMLKPYRESLK